MKKREPSLFDLYERTQKLKILLTAESLVLLSALIALVWLFYRIFLREVNAERHRSIRGYFRAIIRHYLVLLMLAAATTFFDYSFNPNEALARPIPFLIMITVFWGGLILVKTSRLLILQYLFLGSMKAGVPVLIVNIFSLVMSVALVLWAVQSVFDIHLGPLLATSAVFSIILGLALQDTLGNLFAGISLQLDKSFEIGDWLEIVSGTQKFVGQVNEITWRATTMIGWADEMITIPNRVMANSQIFNFQNGELPFARSQSFRVPYGADIEGAKEALLGSIRTTEGVRSYPIPLCFVSETTDSWVNLKLSYYIDRYGSQFLIGDRVLNSGWAALRDKKINPAHQSIMIHNAHADKAP